MKRPLYPVFLIVGLLCVAAEAAADDTASTAQPTRHQLMKVCMAKQKASDGGMPQEEMKKACKDVTKTERQNEKTEKKAADETSDAAPPKN